MPKFTFRYETLLRHRKDVEDQRQRELATRMRSRMIMTHELKSMQQNITGSKQQLGDALVGRVDLSRVGEFTRYNANATLRGRELVNKLAQLEQHIAVARQNLIQATQQRKALEQLREQDRLKWQRHQDRRETAELDDLAAQAYIREQARGAA
jgi:flagellar FliJ protein